MALGYFSRVGVLAVACAALGGCASINASLTEALADKMPLWAGGVPANAPARPGTPDYEKYYQEQTAYQTRMKQARVATLGQDEKSAAPTAAAAPRLAQAKPPAQARTPQRRAAARPAPLPAQPAILATPARQMELENSIQASQPAQPQPGLFAWLAAQTQPQTAAPAAPQTQAQPSIADPPPAPADVPNSEHAALASLAQPAASAEPAAPQNTSMAGIY